MEGNHHKCQQGLKG